MRSCVDFDHPANQAILTYLRQTHVKYKAHLPVSTSPHFLKDPYRELGTHPELVERLWDELAEKIPFNCKWIVYGTPVLVNPLSGIIFGFAFGTKTYALRLPEKERQEMYAAGAKRHYDYNDGSSFDISEVGDDWVLGGWITGERLWCMAAYAYAQQLGNTDRAAN